jgi:cytochrome c oxidase cbb3-type subunit 4
MDSTYEMLAQFARSGGTIYCFVLFLGVLVYALWPANREAFNEAARMPLRED